MAGIALMLGLGCDSPTSSEPATLTEAIDDLAEQYVEVGAMVGVVRGSGHPLYSLLSDCTGSTDAARTAGIRAATTVTDTSSPTVPPRE